MAARAAAGEGALTQFGRMCGMLGIRIIVAHSPQAKGRVKRSKGTHRDRLIKKLRRAGIADYQAANAYLATTYWAGHNARFARPPGSEDDFHTPVPKGVDLEQVVRLETPRTVSQDWVVRHDTRLLQIDRKQRVHAPARSAVLVCEYEDGHLEIWYRGQRAVEMPEAWTSQRRSLTPPWKSPGPAVPRLARPANRAIPTFPTASQP